MTEDPGAEGDMRLPDLWYQDEVPVLLCRGADKPLRLRLPPELAEALWSRRDQPGGPRWNAVQRCWQAPAPRLGAMASQILRGAGQLWLVQPLAGAEAPGCALPGKPCACATLETGELARAQRSRWCEVTDSFEDHDGPEPLLCRLFRAG